MAAPSKTNVLKSIVDIASTLTELLNSFSSAPPLPVPQQSQPKPRPPPLALPRIRTLHLPLSRVEIPIRVSQEFKSIYLAKVKELRRVAQDEYNNLCRSLSGIDFENIAKLLRTSYRASEDHFAQQAIDACLDAHALAHNPFMVDVSNHVKKPFDRTIVAIFEYIFDQPNGNFLNPVDKRRLADLSGMTDRQISVWFQNRRARTKLKIETGGLVEPMTLDKAMVKLRADCEKARLAKVKAAAVQTIIFKKTEKVLIDQPEEHANDDVPCPRDQRELDLRQQYVSGALPNLDIITPSPGSFPEPFMMPEYTMPQFSIPAWPRTSRKQSSEPIKPVTRQEVEDLAKILDDVVELRRTRTQITRRRVTFPLPLPKVVQEAVARRDAARIRSGKKPKPLATQPHPMDEANRAKIIAITSNAEEMLKLNVKRDQVQIRGPQIISERVMGHLSAQMTGMGLVHRPYIAPPLPPTMDTLTTELAQADLNKQHPESESSDTDQESGSEFWDDSVRSGALVIPSLSEMLDAEVDMHEPADVFIPDMLVTSRKAKVNPTDYPLAINTQPECIPLNNVLMDSYTMNEALKMTLKELHWRGPLPPNIDEPFVFNHVPCLAPPLAEACPGFIDDIYRYQDEDGQLSDDAAIMDVIGGELTFDPTTIPDPTPLPAFASAPFPSFLFGQNFEFADSADTSVLPYRVYDSEDKSLPFALSNLAFQASPAQETWESSISDQLYEWDKAPLPYMLTDHAAQFYNNVDTSAEPTFDQSTDPQGSALPFALMHQQQSDDQCFAVASQIVTLEHAVSQPEPLSVYDQHFPDSYMFLAPPPSHLVPNAEPAISFYPSYLPQVPVITKEVHRAASSVHRWIEKLTGITLKAEPFIDPTAMLQYLV